MKIALDYKIDIEIKESDKTKEKLEVYFREFTRSEKKEHEELKKKFEKIIKKAQKIGKKQNSLTEKAELYELNEEYEKALRCIEEGEKLDDEIEKLQAELDELGGGNQTEFAEKSAEDRFEKLVSGKDKEQLKTYAEIKSFTSLMNNLDNAKVELEKKLSGE